MRGIKMTKAIRACASVLLIFTVQVQVALSLGDGIKKNVGSIPVAGRVLLSNDHYLKTCPAAEGIIQRKMMDWFHKDTTLAPSIIRLHFHDCVVRGCDASILLNYEGSERAGGASKTLRGFQVIDDIKAELERSCPRTVSCADILAAAARDATLFLGGPFWEVPFGRKDGRVSLAREADKWVPQGRENVSALIDLFLSRLGLSVLDLVALSGAHTIGRSTCASFLYSRAANRTTAPPARVDASFLNSMRRACKGIDAGSKYVNLDAATPRVFDAQYYANLGKSMGLLSTDQELYYDPRTAPFVSVLGSQPDIFFSQFSASMVKLGNVVFPTRPADSEVRLNCNFVNPR